jgi:hypothetical protein
MGSMYSVHGKDEKCIQNFSHIITREKLTCDDINMHVQGVGCGLAGYGRGVGTCEHRNNSAGFIKCKEIVAIWVAQQAFCFMGFG